MGRNVIARQDGDDYQANFFWIKACGLNIAHTRTSKVSWEIDSTFGFDDVMVSYDPAIMESGSEVTNEYYQVKFHVDHAKGFTCQAFIDPEFIGAKNESLLQRLYKIFKTDPENFASSRYYIINTWGVDHSDKSIGDLLSNTGGIRTQVLFKGGENSQYGKVRKLWKDHLGISSDEELKKMLQPLRIKHSYDDEQRLKETLNYHLSIAGLKPIPADQRSSKYGDLIQKLHKEGKNTFTKKDLLEICEREELLHKTEAVANDCFIIGVRSFQKGAENIQLEVHKLLCLLHHFSGRFILEEYSWDDQIAPQLKALSEEIISAKRPILIHLDTHLSIALYIGYCLDVKYGGLDITIVQKTFNGKVLWKPLSEKINEHSLPIWQYEESERTNQGVDLALSLSVTHDVRSNVEDYVNTRLSSVGKYIHATILPKANYSSIKDASHIVAAVQDLISYFRKGRKLGQPVGKIHLFIAAPNAFAFFLGQYLRPLGSVILYEYDFDNNRDGSYHQVINIP